jgi:hypothetical protein
MSDAQVPDPGLPRPPQVPPGPMPDVPDYPAPERDDPDEPDPNKEPPPLRMRGGVASRDGRRGSVIVMRVVLMLAALAVLPLRAETVRSHGEGFVTRYQSNGGWTGQSYGAGFDDYSEFTDRDGATLHCRTSRQGWQTITECY